VTPLLYYRFDLEKWFLFLPFLVLLFLMSFDGVTLCSYFLHPPSVPRFFLKLVELVPIPFRRMASVLFPLKGLYGDF